MSREHSKQTLIAFLHPYVPKSTKIYPKVPKSTKTWVYLGVKHSQLSLAPLPRVIIVIIEDDIEDEKRSRSRSSAIIAYST